MSHHRRRGASQRAARSAARLEIIQAANRYVIGIRRIRSVVSKAKLLGARQLHTAVFVCRQHHLVDDATLERGGFRPARRRPPLEHDRRAAA